MYFKRFVNLQLKMTSSATFYDDIDILMIQSDVKEEKSEIESK